MTPSTPARAHASAIEELLATPQHFSFFQAVRLLRHAFAKEDHPGSEAFLRNQLRVRALLSLGFPATDLTALEEIPTPEAPEDAPPRPSRFRLTATFLGLYGPSSPLPTFYTEELLDEASDDQSVSRDFLDVVGDGFFTLFFLAWARHRLALRVCEEHDAATLERLFSLTGMGDPKVRAVFSSPGALLRAAGLLSQFPRSAAGLRCLLTDTLQAPVTVEQWVERSVPIPQDQRCILGEDTAQLGETACIGTQACDDTGKIRIEAGPLPRTTFVRCVPGTTEHADLVRTIRFYCTEPVEFDLLLRLDAREAQGAQLGSGAWGQLGYDTWLAPRPQCCPQALFRDQRATGSPPHHETRSMHP